MYRFDYSLVPKCLSSLFTLNQDVHSYQTRSHKGPHICANNCSAYSQSYLFKAPKLWLKLDDNLKLCNTFVQFKNRFKHYLSNIIDGQ